MSVVGPLRPRLTSVLVFTSAFLFLLWRAPELSRFLVNPDHGYQLSLGQQILLGRFPFVDLVYVYGPLAAFTSALALEISGSLIGEVLVCAVFYAATVLMLHEMARERISGAAGWIVPLAALLFLPRFHKWYVWFFPIAALFCFHRQLEVEGSSRRFWILGGLVSGTGALYRLDYGVVFLIFFSILAVLSNRSQKEEERRSRNSWGSFAAAYFAPLLLWLVTLGAVGGASAISRYFSSTLLGGAGAVTDWSLPLPRFSWAEPFGVESAHAIMVGLLPLSYLLCLVVGYRGFSSRAVESRDERFLAAVGLLGLGIYPHGVYRADAAHLFQVIAPVLLAASALLTRGLRSFGEHPSPAPGWRRWPPRAAVLLYAATLILAAARFRDPMRDLAPFESNVWARYRALARELEAVHLPDTVESQVASWIVSATRPNEPILVVPYATQLYYFTRRPMSGLLNSYLMGVHDDEQTRLQNLEHVSLHPPALVVAPRNFLRMRPDRGFRRSQPELYEFLARRYTSTAFARGDWVILKAED